MQLKHGDIWRAIDRLAAKHGYSPSGLAKKAGLSSTVFNISKRSLGTRKRWPSTESIASILRATGASLDDFVALVADEEGASRSTLPAIALADAQKTGVFDEDGHPVGKGWDTIRFPDMPDPNAFALEIGNKEHEPVYRAGDRIVVSPAEKPRRGDRVAIRTTKGEIMIGQMGREAARSVELLTLDGSPPAANLSAPDIEWMYRIVWASQ